jgi:hypothetical protein
MRANAYQSSGSPSTPIDGQAEERVMRRFGQNVRGAGACAGAALIVLAACVDRGPTQVNTSPPTAGAATKSFSLVTLPPSTLRQVLAPQQVTRSAATPFTTSFTLTGDGPSAVLHVTDGDASGNNRATSGSITVDGVEVVGPSVFQKKFASLDLPIVIANPSVIGAQLQGAPGSTITISIDATLATSATLGAAGGTVALLGSQVALAIPPGALTTNTTLTATPVVPPSSGTLPGTSIDLGPEGTTFAQPITVTIAYDPSTLPLGVKPAYLQLEWWNVDHWERLAGNAVDAVHGTVSALTSHFSTYALLPNAVEFCPGDPTAESSFQTAINDAPTGGTLWICNGQFTVAGALGKALTISAENPGQATLAQDPSATGTAAILTVSGVAGGTVALKGLTFSYSNVGLRTLDYDSLLVTGTTFVGPATASLPGQQRAGVWLDLTPAPPTFALFDQDTFSGGNTGLDAMQPVNIVTTNSNFHDMGAFGLAYLTANGSQNPVPAGGTAIMRGGRVEHNTFTNCGLGSGACIALEQSGADTVRFNSINMLSGTVTDGIFVNRPKETSSLTRSAVITDNVITGHAPTGDPSLGASWGFMWAIKDINGVTGGPVDDIERNQISGSWIGLAVVSPSSAFAADNSIAGAFIAVFDNPFTTLNPTAAGPLIAHRNNFSGYTYAVSSNSSPPFVAQTSALAQSLSCNWWGSSSGPTGILPGLDASAYTPFATAPIANTLTLCTP